MKLKRYIAAAMTAVMVLGAACRRESQLEITLPEKYEGKTIELLSYADSTVVATADVKDGRAEFVIQPSDSLPLPFVAQLNIEGRTRAFYIVEPGKATLVADSMSVASGTPLNDRLGAMMARLDSVEQLEDMAAYADLAERLYNENKENVLSTYLGIEWLKFADPSKVDSLLKEAPEVLRTSCRAAHYIEFTRLRAATSPGHPYADFEGETVSGMPVKFSALVKPGKLTLVDFMASWCPYCIKDFSKVAALRSEMADKGLEVISVAVRDKPEDTAAAVRKHGIDWTVMYNTQKRPYDLYGFSGIPHYMVIGPDGKILWRGESLDKAAAFLRNQ